MRGTSNRTLRIAIGSLLALVALVGILSSGDDSDYAEQTGYDSTIGEVDGEEGGTPEGGGSTQFYPGGSITTGDDGELIYSDTNGNGFSSGG